MLQYVMLATDGSAAAERAATPPLPSVAAKETQR